MKYIAANFEILIDMKPWIQNMLNQKKYKTHGTRTCIKRKKIIHGKFFNFCSDKYVYKRIPKDENLPMKGF